MQKTNQKYTLITGASAGIGKELSHTFAQNGYNLILVARTRSKLEELARSLESQFGIKTQVIIKDLSDPLAAKQIFESVRDDALCVDILVNNAGVGVGGNFIDSSDNDEMNLMQINITALTMMCKYFAEAMVQQGGGKIVNIASTAAFQPGPYMSTYYASKAYVLSFSEALSVELNSKNISVTTICPGVTQTDFFATANIIGTNLAQSPLMMSAKQVAEITFNACVKGRGIVIPGLINKLMAFMVRLTPRSIITRITGSLNKKSAS